MYGKGVRTAGHPGLQHDPNHAGPDARVVFITFPVLLVLSPSFREWGDRQPGNLRCILAFCLILGLIVPRLFV